MRFHAGHAGFARILTSLIVFSLGCSSPVVEPRDEAEERCAWHPHGLPEAPFTSDVCSAWPDGDWGECCIDHDIDYWCGGTNEQRASADQRFFECIDEDHSAALAWTMWLGVRAGGHPILPFPWRWGYGRAWPTSYLDDEALDDDSNAVSAALSRHDRMDSAR